MTDTVLKKEIIKTMLYFDIFSYPLDQEEVHRFCSKKADLADVQQALKELQAQKMITQDCCYFSVAGREKNGLRRSENYWYSKKKMKTALRNAGMINRFPFVRGVAISGSLSKYSADRQADIDYFIITDAKRLWICRSFLHLFKKFTYLFGRQHDFCMNYFLDLEELLLKDQNIYTAIEAVTIIPVHGQDVFDHFLQKNQWVKQFLPNHADWFRMQQVPPEKGLFIKRFTELLFSGKWGLGWNQILRKWTMRKWEKKFKRQGFPMQHFAHDLRSSSGESKNHPHDHQRKILTQYDQKIENCQYLKRASYRLANVYEEKSGSVQS